MWLRDIFRRPFRVHCPQLTRGPFLASFQRTYRDNEHSNPGKNTPAFQASSFRMSHRLYSGKIKIITTAKQAARSGYTPFFLSWSRHKFVQQKKRFPKSLPSRKTGIIHAEANPCVCGCVSPFVLRGVCRFPTISNGCCKQSPWS